MEKQPLTNATLTGSNPLVDGARYLHCRFIDCRLRYAGGEQPEFVGCIFQNCSWELVDKAAATVAFLSQLSRIDQDGGAARVSEIIALMQ